MTPRCLFCEGDGTAHPFATACTTAWAITYTRGDNAFAVCVSCGYKVARVLAAFGDMISVRMATEIRPDDPKGLRHPAGGA